jgi:hypothetical protein
VTNLRKNLNHVVLPVEFDPSSHSNRPELNPGAHFKLVVTKNLEMSMRKTRHISIQIFQKFAEIFVATGVVDTGGKCKKSSVRKVFIISWTSLGSRVGI